VQVDGDITFNGRPFDDFVPLRTASYVEQSDTVGPLPGSKHHRLLGTVLCLILVCQPALNGVQI